MSLTRYRLPHRKVAVLLVMSAAVLATDCPGLSTTGGPATTGPTPGGTSPFPRTADWTQRAVDTASGLRPVAVAIADFDADGLPDIAAGYAGADGFLPAVFLFFQVDADTWTPVGPRVDPSLISLAGLAAMAAGDLDGDGRSDVVLAVNGRLVYLHSPPDPREGAAWNATVFDQSFGSGIGQWNDVAIAEIDGINGPDLVACGTLPGRLSWFRSPGSGSQNGLGWARFDVDLATRTGAASVALRDLDGDTRIDIVSTAPGETENRVAWYRNPSDLLTERWTKHPIGNLSDATRLAVADLNADGRLDVVVTSPVLRQVGWYVGPEDPASAWSGFLLAQYASATPIDIHVADIDGNGQLDAVVPTRQPGSLRWFTPVGSSTDVWVENNLGDTAEDVGRIALGNLSPDPRPDVAAPLRGADPDPDRIIWLMNPE